MERKVSLSSDSSEIVSDPETESDFIPPSPLSPLPLTLSEEKRVEQCTRIGLVATHKCSSDILTEGDRREMAAIRASLGMLPRQNEGAARNRDHCDEQEEEEDSFRDSMRHQQDLREDEDTSHYSTSQLNEVNNHEKLTQSDTSKTEIPNQISTRQCDLQLDNGQISQESLPVVSRQSPASRAGNKAEILASVRWRGEKWRDSACDDEPKIKLDEHKSNIERKTTCEDHGRRCSIRDREMQQEVGLHNLTADKEWSEETDKHCHGDRPLDCCRCRVQRCRRSGTTVKCRGLQRDSKVCAYSKHCILTNKLMPMGPSVHSARSCVARSDWLLCALCRNQFHIGQEAMFCNSSLFRGSQLLTKQQDSCVPQACRPSVYSTALPLTTTLHSLPYVRTRHKPISQSPRGSYFQQYMMKKRQSTDWRCTSFPPQPSSIRWRPAVGQSLRYSTAHAKPLHLRPLPVTRTKGYITTPKTYTDVFYSRSHKHSRGL